MMKAYISVFKEGKSRIELVDDKGFYHDIIEVDEIRVELDRENMEPFVRQENRHAQPSWKQ